MKNFTSASLLVMVLLANFDIMGQLNSKAELDLDSYELLHSIDSGFQNFFVLIKFEYSGDRDLRKFFERFRDKYCRDECNIHLFDEPQTAKNFEKPASIPKDEYCEFADHYIAANIFNSTRKVRMYPFRDGFQMKGYYDSVCNGKWNDQVGDGFTN